MSQSLWIAKTGLDAQQTKMATISNNLANVSTNGFKRGRAIFEDLLYQMSDSPAHSPRRTPCCPPAFRSVRVLVSLRRSVCSPRVSCADRQRA